MFVERKLDITNVSLEFIYQMVATPSQIGRCGERGCSPHAISIRARKRTKYGIYRIKSSPKANATNYQS